MRPHSQLVVSLLKDNLHSVIAEVGVFRGMFTVDLLSRLPGITKYYCIDPWELYDDHLATLQRNSCERTVSHENIFRQFKKKIEPWRSKVVIIRKMSQDALVNIPDDSLDAVFIDANHSYEYTKADILGWTPKVKVGGLISGHDIVDKGKAKGVVRAVPFGVEKAVKELLPGYQMNAHANVWWIIKRANL